MALRFRKSFKVAPGVKLNVSKSGLGMSAGVKGARVGVNSRGTYTSASIPGTGVSHFAYHSSDKTRSVSTKSVAQMPVENNLRTPTTPHKDNSVWLISLNALALLIIWPIGIITTLVSVVHYLKTKDSATKTARRSIRSGMQDLQNNKYGEAASELASAYEVFPDDVNLAFNLAYSYGMSEQPEKAIPLFQKYTTNYEDEFDAKLYLALCHIKTEQYDNAIHVLQTLPDEPESVKMLRIINLAECFTKKGLLDAAIEVLKTAPLRKRKLDAALLEVHYQLGDIFELQDKHKMAQKHWQKVYMHDAEYKDVKTKISK